MNVQKEGDCLKIAFYGKGGIGKSTVAANISAALSIQGLYFGINAKILPVSYKGKEIKAFVVLDSI